MTCYSCVAEWKNFDDFIWMDWEIKKKEEKFVHKSNQCWFMSVLRLRVHWPSANEFMDSSHKSKFTSNADCQFLEQHTDHLPYEVYSFKAYRNRPQPELSHLSYKLNQNIKVPTHTHIPLEFIRWQANTVSCKSHIESFHHRPVYIASHRISSHFIMFFFYFLQGNEWK